MPRRKPDRVAELLRAGIKVTVDLMNAMTAPERGAVEQRTRAAWNAGGWAGKATLLIGELERPEPETELEASRQEETLFRGWIERVLAFDRHEGPEAELERLRAELIGEIHDDRASRHPLGIASRLSEVIDLLALDGTCEDNDAIDVLEELVQDEVKSRELNGGGDA